jgi:glucokinase
VERKNIAEAGNAVSALVGDLGGTNVRFALAASDAEGRPTIGAVRAYQVAEFPGLAQAAMYYLGQISGPLPDIAIIAVASAVTGDSIRMTNNSWSFSVSSLKRDLGMREVHVVNDYAAIGRSLAHLTEGDLQRISTLGRIVAASGRDSSCCVLGPGTGLGVCHVVTREGRTLVLDSEGGHIAFAPFNDYEMHLLQVLLNGRDRVSVERLVSGPGLCTLHAAVRALEGLPPELVTPEEVTAAARDGSDSSCVRAVETVCAILGSFAGDVALVQGAWDGVYLGGGLTATLLPWIERGAFRERFEAKGRFRPLMQKVPTLAITHPQPGLLGAAAIAGDYSG